MAPGYHSATPRAPLWHTSPGIHRAEIIAQVEFTLHSSHSLDSAPRGLRHSHHRHHWPDRRGKDEPVAFGGLQDQPRHRGFRVTDADGPPHTAPMG